MGGTLGMPEARFLLARAGHDQWRLANELQKIIANQPEPSRETIEQLVAHSAKTAEGANYNDLEMQE